LVLFLTKLLIFRVLVKQFIFNVLVFYLLADIADLHFIIIKFLFKFCEPRTIAITDLFKVVFISRRVIDGISVLVVLFRYTLTIRNVLFIIDYGDHLFTVDCSVKIFSNSGIYRTTFISLILFRTVLPYMAVFLILHSYNDPSEPSFQVKLVW